MRLGRGISIVAKSTRHNEDLVSIGNLLVEGRVLLNTDLHLSLARLRNPRPPQDIEWHPPWVTSHVGVVHIARELGRSLLQEALHTLGVVPTNLR